jgi:hypothetical protein
MRIEVSFFKVFDREKAAYDKNPTNIKNPIPNE